MPEEVARFTVLLEDIQTQVRVIADGHVGLFEHLTRMDARLGRLETRFDGLETQFRDFADDTTRRLERIETHLGLHGRRPRRTPARSASPRHRKKSAKPT